MKKLISIIFLASTLAFSHDINNEVYNNRRNVKIIECNTYSELQNEVNKFIRNRKVEDINITMSSSNQGFKTIFYVACITYINI